MNQTSRTSSAPPLTLDAALRHVHAGTIDAALGRCAAQDRDRLEAAVAAALRRDHQENQLVHYVPVNADAERFHLSTARICGIQGGLKSGKTGTLLAEVAIQLTGLVPDSLAARYPRAKLRPPPVRARLVVTTLKVAWDTNLKKKLQWWEWNGPANADGLLGDPDLGHWGWIPRAFLLKGEWDESWDAAHFTLALTNGSSLVVMAHEQDTKDFNQGSFHVIAEDEIPPENVHRANKFRLSETRGQLLIGGTPPDEEALAAPVAWYQDEVLRPGLESSNPEETFAIQLFTEQNRTMSPAEVAFQRKGLTMNQQRARLHGEFIHLTGVIFPGLKEKPAWWCFHCDDTVYPGEQSDCPGCGRPVLQYCHVWDEEELAWPGPDRWPVLFYFDPHPARPAACAWYKVDPQDAWWQIAELEVQGDAARVKHEVDAFERDAGFEPVWRKGDPKITIQSNQFAREFDGRRFTIREAFEEVGFAFEEANTNFTVARERILAGFKPNPLTSAPRIRFHRRCTRTLYQLSRFTWLTPKREPVGLRAQPSKQHSDFPALLRYLANDDPSFRDLERVQRVEPIRYVRGEGRSVSGW